MATTYNWTIDSMWTEDVDTYSNFVVRAYYSIEAVDGDYTANYSDIAMFEVVQGEDFIPYADLTEAIVLGWIQDELGQDTIDNIYASLDGQINTEKNPPVEPTNTPLPWS